MALRCRISQQCHIRLTANRGVAIRGASIGANKSVLLTAKCLMVIWWTVEKKTARPAEKQRRRWRSLMTAYCHDSRLIARWRNAVK